RRSGRSRPRRSSSSAWWGRARRRWACASSRTTWATSRPACTTARTARRRASRVRRRSTGKTEELREGATVLAYIARRALLAIFTVWAISVLSFAIIQLPPGDYVTSYIAQMASMGSVVSDEEAQNLRIQYGLGQPIYVQYFKWMKLVIRGQFGMSMEWRRPLTQVLRD